jgi:group II intron reverse transcriptase/maturase
VNDETLLEQVLSRDNMRAALKRVEDNKGAPGTDGMRVGELRSFLVLHWPHVRDAILTETYRPQPVKRVEIPKPAGGTRALGIPSVLDRLIQQGIAQVLSPIFEPVFSEHSYGFRPKRSAHDAVRKALEYANEGWEWVVDIDLEKFFDRVNHDKLMARVARRVKDKRLLRLIRSYLEAGVMLNGVVIDRTDEGTPQGGPLSPLLSNIMLDDLDKELERRGLKFARYADDCNIYVRSARAGLRVKDSITRFLAERLSLKVNETKSAVDRPWRRDFLSFSMLAGTPRRLRVAKSARARAERQIRQRTKRSRSESLAQRIKSVNSFLQGWVGYFALADTPSIFRELDKWIRRRMRMFLWKQWKRARTRFQNLRKLGLSEHLAWEGAGSKRSYWRLSKSPPLHQALSNKYWQAHGLISLADRHQQLRQAWMNRRTPQWASTVV